MNEIMAKKDPPVRVALENERQYQEYLRVRQSLTRRVPVGIAS